ncbi:unnamed protein product, partial [Choristocarpus tenellus]
KDYVTGIGDGEVVSAQPTQTKGPLVIPLAANTWEESGTSLVNGLAAEAIANESRDFDGLADLSRGLGGDLGMGSTRVIGMLPGAGDDSGTSVKRKTLLAQSMIPGITELKGEDAKFKHDLKHRANDIDVKSDAYRAVPVAEFGAALLRGMGWTGPSSEDQDAGSELFGQVEPRHFRLGLGAQPRPP